MWLLYLLFSISFLVSNDEQTNAFLKRAVVQIIGTPLRLLLVAKIENNLNYI